MKLYISICYRGVIASIRLPVGDSSMRVIGDMKRLLVVMMVCAVLKPLPDPVLVLGLSGFASMGMAGVSPATVISQYAGMVTTLSLLHFQYQLIDLRYRSASELLESWHAHTPCRRARAIVRVVPQILQAVLTRLAANVGGVTAVDAVAAASRIESFALIISMVVGTALVPITG